MEILLILLHSVLIFATVTLIREDTKMSKLLETERENMGRIRRHISKTYRALWYSFLILNGIIIIYLVWGFVTKVGIV